MVGRSSHELAAAGIRGESESASVTCTVRLLDCLTLRAHTRARAAGRSRSRRRTVIGCSCVHGVANVRCHPQKPWKGPSRGLSLDVRSSRGLSLKTVFVMETAEDRLRDDTAAYGKHMAV